MEINGEATLSTDRISDTEYLETHFVSVKEECFEESLNSQALDKGIPQEVSAVIKNDNLEEIPPPAQSIIEHGGLSVNQSIPTNNHCEGGKVNFCHGVVDVSLCRRGQIDVIDMQSEEASAYKCFFVYEDQFSKFVVLKALRNNNAKEVAMKLLDVLIIIGAPQVLQSNNGRKFAEQVVQELRSLWKGFVILHGEISKQDANSRDFKSLLKCWLQKNPSKTWYEGLKFIQIFQNSTFQCQDGKIPCDILFGRSVHEEFQKMTETPMLKESIWAEEEWIGHLSNKQENSNTDQNLDDQTEDSNFVNTGDMNNHERDSDSNSYEYKDTLIKVCGFNFVNVKSELPLNMQIEDTDFADESVMYDNERPTDNEDLKCKICKKRYIKLGHLRNHMKVHTRGTKFECSLCKKTFNVQNLYEKHMRQSHGTNEQPILNSERRWKDPKLTVTNESAFEKQELLNKPNLILDLVKPEPYVASNNVNSTKSLTSSSKRKCLSKNRTKFIGEPTLECTFCKQKFSFPSVLKRHMRSHTNERPYVCEVCNKSFKQLGHLSQHSLTHKDYRSFRCVVCGVKFESLDSFKTHMQSHKGECFSRTKEVFRLFECDNCKKVFPTKSVLERHIFTHSHERQFGCKVCGKRFKQTGHVKSHMLVHTGERKFECTVCQKRFSLSNSLKKHMYVHNGEKPYQCDVCGARFLEKRNLNGHLLTHTNERPFRCKICGKRYTLADTLRRHISAAHEDGRTYQCEICAKMFKQLAHLSVHKKVHNDERPFQCHLCDKNFKHKNVLKSHLAIHANVRKFECDVCKATFIRKTNLQTHITSAHTNERPYGCIICGKRFKQISHLNGHAVVHNNSMPYQCDYCDRRCNRLDNLKKHMRLHMKNKE